MISVKFKENQWNAFGFLTLRYLNYSSNVWKICKWEQTHFFYVHHRGKNACFPNQLENARSHASIIVKIEGISLIFPCCLFLYKSITPFMSDLWSIGACGYRLLSLNGPLIWGTSAFKEIGHHGSIHEYSINWTDNVCRQQGLFSNYIRSCQFIRAKWILWHRSGQLDIVHVCLSPILVLLYFVTILQFFISIIFSIAHLFLLTYFSFIFLNIMP